MTPQVRCVLPTRYVVGEGPVWSAGEQALYFVDIMAPSVERFDPLTGDHHRWVVPDLIGSCALRAAGGGAVLALRNGFWLLDFASGVSTPLADLEADRADTRLNDGKCDAAGRFWAGSMHLPETEERGALYRLDPDHTVHRMRSGVVTSNGLGWSPDGATMYHTDSMRGIFVSDYDVASGTLSNERVFVRHPPRGGRPDGLAVDVEGYVWSANWDGWDVVRYAPDGSVDRIVEMPVQCPTSCAFGGPDLDQLYITSASYQLPFADAPPGGELAGGLFVLDAGVRGLPVQSWGG